MSKRYEMKKKRLATQDDNYLSNRNYRKHKNKKIPEKPVWVDCIPYSLLCFQVPVTTYSPCLCRPRHGKGACSNWPKGTAVSHAFVNSTFIRHSLKLLTLVCHLNPDWCIFHISFTSKLLEEANHQNKEGVKMESKLRSRKKKQRDKRHPWNGNQGRSQWKGESRVWIRSGLKVLEKICSRR